MLDVLLIEDESLVVDAASYRIKLSPHVRDLHVCGTASDALQVLRAEPDRWGLILLDLGVPGADGLSLAAEIKQLGKASITCVLTGESRNDYLAQVKELGFQGFLSKKIGLDDLVRDLHRVIAGEQVFTEPDRNAPASRVARLTKRQIECLQIVRDGGTDKDIARILGLSIRTATQHVQAAMDELNVSKRAQAVDIASQLGLLPRSTSSGRPE